MKRIRRFFKRYLLTIILYAVLFYVLGGIAVFLGTAAYLERGYFAIGGEGFLFAALLCSVFAIVIPKGKK